MCVGPFLFQPHPLSLRLGSADGGRDEGVGSNWSGVCHRPVEFSSHALHLEGGV